MAPHHLWVAAEVVTEAEVAVDEVDHEDVADQEVAVEDLEVEEREREYFTHKVLCVSRFPLTPGYCYTSEID